MNPFVIGLLGLGSVVALVALTMVMNFVGLWVQAFVSGAPIPFIELVLMRFRKVEPKTIVHSYISAVKAGVNIPIDRLESHYLAGGRVTSVVRALITAHNAGIDFAWEEAAAMDLAGQDVASAIDSVMEAHDVERAADENLRELIGARAVVGSGFLPTGSIRIGGEVYPATAESNLESGAAVVVTGVQHGCLRVGPR